MTRTSTGNAVGMERAEGARNAQKDPRIEARERLEAWERARREWDACGSPDLAKNIERGEDLYFAGSAVAADLRTILSALSEAEGELDRMREVVTDIAAMTDPKDDESYRADDREGCLDTVHETARAALSPTRRTGDQ